MLAEWWAELDHYVRAEIRGQPGNAQAYLKEKNPVCTQPIRPRAEDDEHVRGRAAYRQGHRHPGGGTPCLKIAEIHDPRASLLENPRSGRHGQILIDQP